MEYKRVKLSRGNREHEAVTFGADGDGSVMFRNLKLAGGIRQFIPELLDEFLRRWNAHEELVVMLQEAIDLGRDAAGRGDKAIDSPEKANDTCERYDVLVEELQGDNDDLSAEADVLSEECDDLDAEVDRLREDNAKLEAGLNYLRNHVKVQQEEIIKTELEVERLADDLSREKRAHSYQHVYAKPYLKSYPVIYRNS